MSLCEVCWLPSPQPTCSERFRGLRKRKAAAMQHSSALSEVFVSHARQLAKEMTVCPGELSKRALEGVGIVLDARDSLLCLRELIFCLRAEKSSGSSRRDASCLRARRRCKGPSDWGRRDQNSSSQKVYLANWKLAENVLVSNSLRYQGYA